MTSSFDGPPYQEAADDRYAELAQSLGWDPLRPPEAVTRQFASQVLGDGTRVVPIPLLLEPTEVQRGVVQRARALQRFFADVVLGDGRFLRAGTGLTESLLDGIVRSEGTSLWELRKRWRGQTLDAVRFVYGPDLARAPSGRWVVLEDNVGCVGGCADSFLTFDAYAKACGLGPQRPRMPDLAVAASSWLDRLQLRPEDGGVVALLTDAHGARWIGGIRFDEDLRRQRIIHQLGVRVVDNDDLERITLESGSGLSSLRAMINIGVPSARTWPMLLDGFFGSSRLPLLNAPGTSMLGSKAFLPFVGDMIAFYLDEEVILEAPLTIILRDARLPDDAGAWLVKAAAGCGGEEVHELRSQTREQLQALERRLKDSWPEDAFIAQQRVELSRLVANGVSYLVELRALGYVLGWEDVLVGKQCLATLTPLEDGQNRLLLAPVLTTNMARA